jgi:hypothetical protein
MRDRLNAAGVFPAPKDVVVDDHPGRITLAE